MARRRLYPGRDYVRLRCTNPRCNLYFLALLGSDEQYCFFCTAPRHYPIFNQALPEFYLYQLPISAWLIHADQY